MWVLAFLFTLATYTFTDDHFDRISRARQIARYGELPFRDFFDPGYFLTEVASAAVQRLAGDNLLGEMILTSAFITAGAGLVFALVRRVAPSGVSATVIAAVTVLSARRPYDFDKFFFYPLGILLCWRYIDRPATRVVVCETGRRQCHRYRLGDNGVRRRPVPAAPSDRAGLDVAAGTGAVARTRGSRAG